MTAPLSPMPRPPILIDDDPGAPTSRSRPMTPPSPPTDAAVLAASPPRRFSRGRAEWLGALAAVVAGLNILPNDFCHDGKPIVRDNPRVNAPDQWIPIWTTDYWSETARNNPTRDLLYRPVALASYRLVRILFGVRALPHHVVNLLLYAALCALIARTCRHLGGSETAATVAAVAFAVLPIHTEVLGDIVGRADLLAAVGVMLVILAHRRSLATASTVRALAWRTTAGLVAFTAMGSKESAVGLVVLVPLFDALWFRRIAVERRDHPWLSLSTVGRLWYLILPAAVYLGLRHHALGGALYQQPNITKTINVLADSPTWQHALGVVQLWGMYWSKMLWPGVLSVSYSINAIRLATDPFDRHVVLGMVAAAALALLSVIEWRAGRRVFAVLAAALVVCYAPTSNAFPLLQVFLAERVWFLPSVWIALMAGILASRLPPRGAWCAVALIAAGAMTVRDWVRESQWRTDGTLYAAAYRDMPDAVTARFLYGQWLVAEGEFDRGVALLRSALDIDLGYTDAYRALGLAYHHQGRLAEAVHYLTLASMQVPGHPPTEAALAEAGHALAVGDTELARLRKVAEDQPDDLDSQLALVRRLRDLGLVREAVECFETARGRFAGRAAWHAEYAVTLVYANQRDAAIAHYGRAIDLDPNDPQGHIELAMLLIERRAGDDLDQATALADRALTLAPQAPVVLRCAAEIAALRGDLSAAVTLYRKAIALLPAGSSQRREFEERARALGR